MCAHTREPASRAARKSLPPFPVLLEGSDRGAGFANVINLSGRAIRLNSSLASSEFDFGHACVVAGIVGDEGCIVKKGGGGNPRVSNDGTETKRFM